MKKYSIVTLIIGDYELLRDPLEVDPEAEYICVTDRDDLISNVWTIYKDNDLVNENTNTQNVWTIKYKKLFTYCSTNYCLRIDGSIQLCKSLNNIINEFINSNSDIWCMLHPYNNTYKAEYNAWLNMRNLPQDYVNNFFEFCNNSNYNIDMRGLIECTIIFYKINDITNNFNTNIFNTLKKYNNLLDRNDQCYFSVILLNNFKNLNITFLCEQAIHSKYMKWYKHNTNNEITYPSYDLNIPTKHYWNDTLVTCKYLI